MKKKKWVVTSVLTMPIIAMISCETPNEIQNDLDLELPPLPQPVLRPEEPNKPEKPKSTTPEESSPTTPPTTPKPEEPKKIDPINTQPSDDKPILDESKKTKDPSDSLNKQESNSKPTKPSDKSEEPKIEGNFPNQAINKISSKKTLPQVLVPKQVDTKSDEKLKETLDAIPNSLVIAQDKVKKFEGNLDSILYEFKHNIPNNWDYVNFIDPISNISKNDYKISLDFSNATKRNNQIENVKFKLTNSYENAKSKYVSLVLSKDFSSEINLDYIIKKKELSDNFSGIFPSFLAYALTHTNKTTNDSIFSDFNYAVENLGFGVGLIDAFVEIKNNAHHHYKPYVVKVSANDDKGTLDLTVTAKNEDENNLEFSQMLEEQTFSFNNLAKNSDGLVKFVINESNLKNDIKKILSQNNNNTKSIKIRQKLELTKLIKKNLQIHIGYGSKKTNYKLGLFNVDDKLKNSNHILFPQIIFFHSLKISDYSNNLINFELNNNTLKYTWNLDYQYLNFTQPITESDDLFPGESKTTTLTGTIDLN